MFSLPSLCQGTRSKAHFWWVMPIYTAVGKGLRQSHKPEQAKPVLKEVSPSICIWPGRLTYTENIHSRKGEGTILIGLFKKRHMVCRVKWHTNPFLLRLKNSATQQLRELVFCHQRHAMHALCSGLARLISFSPEKIQSMFVVRHIPKQEYSTLT